MSAENFGIKEAAKKLNMGVPTLRKLVKDRKIGSEKQKSKGGKKAKRNKRAKEEKREEVG